MPDNPERTEQWSGSTNGGDDEDFNGLDLAEVPTAPAHLEDEQGGTAEPAQASPAQPGRVAAEAAQAPVRRRRGGRPRVTAEQDQRILEAFERAKKENRSLREVANELARELGQPADYINQRYYYLQRKARPEGVGARAAGGRRRGAAGRAEAPRRAAPAAGAPARAEKAPAPAEGRRGGRRAAAARTAPPAPTAAPAAAPAPAAGDLAAISRALSELSELTRSQLTAIVDRLQKLESRLTSLERQPAGADANVDQVLERLGQVLQERSRAARSRDRVKGALQEFLKTLEESV
ncbi:hypothetical protein U7230_13020 [Carboxydochorda subterranea]|uniref:Uncharacterized protein n=1 Tax=Carboxydichorda subterranea TaxID=3109565 RepID=A0ABZ1BWJ7_9FIRM|nr:hypothetical protein [Limnochorda sp. L945t]WRP16995.1 hypothetical protein U7230_13020 [Limnochorda sp. L945t]